MARDVRPPDPPAAEEAIPCPLCQEVCYGWPALLGHLSLKLKQKIKSVFEMDCCPCCGEHFAPRGGHWADGVIGHLKRLHAKDELFAHISLALLMRGGQ